MLNTHRTLFLIAATYSLSACTPPMPVHSTEPKPEIQADTNLSKIPLLAEHTHSETKTNQANVETPSTTATTPHQQTPIAYNTLDNKALTKQLQILTQQNETNIPWLLTQLFHHPYSINTEIHIHKTLGEISDHYDAHLTFSDQDSDAGIRSTQYAIQIEHTLSGIWIITEAKESWSCWNDSEEEILSNQRCTPRE